MDSLYLNFGFENIQLRILRILKIQQDKDGDRIIARFGIKGFKLNTDSNSDFTRVASSERVLVLAVRVMAPHPRQSNVHFLRQLKQIL